MQYLHDSVKHTLRMGKLNECKIAPILTKRATLIESIQFAKSTQHHFVRSMVNNFFSSLHV